MNGARKIVKEGETNKNKSLKREKLIHCLLKYLTRIERLLLILYVMCFFSFLLIMYLANGELPSGYLDLILAFLSFLTLLFSTLNSKLSKKQKYVIMYSLFLLLYSIGLVGSIILFSYIEKQEIWARILTLVCLAIAIIIEFTRMINNNRDIDEENEQKRLANIGKIEKNSSIVS